MKEKTPIYGMMAEFDTASALVNGVEKTRAEGYREVNAYTPYPVHGLAEALGFEKSRLPLVVLIGGIVGCLGGFFLQYYAAAVNYPFNIGGRPLNSWPAFIPVTFECTILVAGFAAVLGMLGLNGLPMPYHPVFNAERFALASRDRFFLCIEARDPKFDHDRTWEFLTTLKPHAVRDVDE